VTLAHAPSGQVGDAHKFRRIQQEFAGMPKSKRLSASMEDYLEAIYHIVSEKKAARAKDIAVRMAVNSASVTGALRLLADKGHINYAPYDVITLTPEGETLARDIVRRHEILKDFFTKILDVNEQEAEDNACKMEHAISPLIIDRLVRFVEFIQVCPRGGEEWIGGFRQFCEKDDTLSGCEDAISRCLDDLKKRQEQFQHAKSPHNIDRLVRFVEFIQICPRGGEEWIGGFRQFCEKDDALSGCEYAIAKCLDDLKKRQKQFQQAKREVITLESLESGQVARLIRVKGKGTLVDKLKELDITPGSIIELEDVETTADSVNIKVRGYHLSLRRDDFSKIELELL
jgi:Mn-dependent DtxR family transcriptional regulator/Fe2+ transport system protein FeoA